MYRIEGDKIFFDNDFNDDLTEDILNEIGHYSKIKLGWNFNQPLDFLPQGLKELTIINPNYSHDLLNLPQGLKKIKISQNYKGQIVQLPNCEKIEI